MVGSRVLEILSSDFEIIAPSSSELDLTKAGNFEAYMTDPSHKLIGGKLTIVNFVAFTNVDGAEKESGDTNGLCYRLNAQLPGEIAEWCHDFGNRFIHISTDYVFDGMKDSPYTEEDITNPLGWYGATKLQGDEWILESIEKGADCLILRIEMPYGSRSPKKKDLAAILLERLKNNQPIQAVDDSHVTPLFIDDFAQILKIIIETQDIVGLYNIAPTDSVTLWQFVGLIAKHAQLNDSIVTTIPFHDYWKDKIASGSAKRPKDSWLDSTKLQAKIGAEYFHSVEENVRQWVKNLS